MPWLLSDQVSLLPGDFSLFYSFRKSQEPRDLTRCCVGWLSIQLSASTYRSRTEMSGAINDWRLYSATVRKGALSTNWYAKFIIC